MSSTKLTQLGFAAAILYAAYKFGGNMGKAGAVAVASVIVAKQVPYVKDVV